MDKIRTFAFIDAENVRNSAEKLGYEDLDYKKLRKWLHKRNIEKTFLYVGIEQGDTIKKDKFNELQTLGFVVNSKQVMAYKQEPLLIPTICTKCKNSFIRKYYVKDKKKANCDCEFTLDITRAGLQNEFDQIIMFTGDGDFCYLMEYVATTLKKDVIVISPSGIRTSTKIKDLAKRGIIQFQNLEGLFEYYATPIPQIV